MDLSDAFILTATHGAFGGFMWLLCDVRHKAQRERSRMSRAAVRAWAENAQREAELAPIRDVSEFPLDHPGYGRLLLELGARMECPPTPQGLEVDMVARQNERAAQSEWSMIDLRDGER